MAVTVTHRAGEVPGRRTRPHVLDTLGGEGSGNVWMHGFLLVGATVMALHQ
jgi:hypothetical protein